MKKLSLSALIVASLIPGLAFAATGDVNINTSVALSVNGIALTVSGATATIESIAVGATSFSVTLPSGSSFEVTADSLNQLSADNTIWQNENTNCDGSSSVLGYNNVGGSSVTITITPSSTLCANAAVATHTSHGDGRSGGGSSSSYVAPVPTVVTTQSTTVAAQIASIQAKIAELSGATLPNSASVTTKAALTANLSKGSRGSGVKGLQQFLNTHGFVIASSGPGSVGNETDSFGTLTVQAVQKFQIKYGIATSGTPGYGSVGPKTRAKINELSK